MNVEETLLQFALKSKGFIAELTTKTKESYYPGEFRGAIKVLFDYFNKYKELPSQEALFEFADQAGLGSGIGPVKETLDRAYAADKSALVDGDFDFLIDKLKQQYNDALIKSRVSVLKEHLQSDHDVKEVNEVIKKMYFDINSLNASEVYAQGTLQDSAKDRWLMYKEIKANPELAKGIPSGFRDLDQITNGFKGSEVVLISGPTSSGKSILLMNMAINAWLGNNKIDKPQELWDDSGHNIWFVSIENPKMMMERRIDSCLSGVAYDHIRDGTYDEEEGKLLYSAIKFQHKYDKKFYVSDLGRGVSVNVIEAQYEKLLSQFEPDMLVIDYLGIMKPNNPAGHDWLDQGSNAADLHELSRVINKPILTASQMKSALRTPGGLKRFIGDPESVARSKMITDNVNMNLQIKKDEDFHVSSYLELYVAKNRDGKTGDVITLQKEFYRQRVCDVEGALLVRPDTGEMEEGY